MLAIARALVGNPTVLLMDEPTEGLAPIVVEQLEQTIKALGQDQGMALVLVEQHAALALDFAPRCDRDGPRPDRLRWPERRPSRTTANACRA